LTVLSFCHALPPSMRLYIILDSYFLCIFFWCFCQAIFPPQAVETVALPGCGPETIRITFNSLNASNKTNDIRHIAF
jgi:hypothetical protein